MRNTIEACAYVDELGEAATGEVVVSGEAGARGTVFVERGRVCWAAAHGMARRLTELLGARASLPSEVMESVFTACKRERIPLGEHLLSRGLVSAHDLRATLLQHTMESLSTICTDDARATWHARAGAGYSPRFTFTTSELVVFAGAREHPSLSTSAGELLGELFGEREWAAAFVRSAASAHPEPVAAHGIVPPSASALLRIGKWASSVLDVAEVFSDDSAFISATRASASGTSSVVAFRHGATVVAGETGALGPGRVLNHRAQKRRRRVRNDADL